MAETDDHRFPGAGGSGHLRAAHADREHVIGVLKTAFVRGLIDKNEFDQRVSRTFASRTYAELAGVTRDLPADLPEAAPLPIPAPAATAEPSRMTMKRAAIISAYLLIPILLANVLALISNGFNDNGGATFAALLAFVAWTVVSGTLLTEAWDQRRARRRPPQGPESGAGHRAAGGSRTRQRRSPGPRGLTLAVTV
jgi:hypothetical protein